MTKFAEWDLKEEGVWISSYLNIFKSWFLQDKNLIGINVMFCIWVYDTGPELGKHL